MFGVKFDDIAVQHVSVDEEFKASFAHVPEALWADGFTHLQFVEIAKYDQQQDYILLKQHLAERPYLTHKIVEPSQVEAAQQPTLTSESKLEIGAQLNE